MVLHHVLDAELKLIYSAFTKIPSLAIHASGLDDPTIEEMSVFGPLDTAVPLSVFKNLQSCVLPCSSVPQRYRHIWLICLLLLSLSPADSRSSLSLRLPCSSRPHTASARSSSEMSSLP
jgi:hypothetical protein